MRVMSRVIVVLALVAVPVVVRPGAAAASTPVDGYVWADRPSEASYTVTNSYRYNSTGGDIQIDRPSAGVYAVRFVGMGAAGGVAHARPYGWSNTAICTVASWKVSGADQVVNVRCFNSGGTPADTRFTASFTNRTSAADTFAYLWANDASPVFDVPYTPSSTYSYDSSGIGAQVWRQSVGVYMMTIGTVDAHYPVTHHDGIYQVTAYNKNPVRCEVHGENDEMPTPIAVFCVDPSGAPVDTRFAVTYANGVSPQGTGGVAGNVHFRYFSDDPTTWWLEGWWNAGGAPTITRFVAGRYRVTFPGLAVAGGHAVTGARGNPSTACVVASWSASAVNVHCFDTTTLTLTDSEFNVALIA
jgi:hypothetical protein